MATFSEAQQAQLLQDPAVKAAMQKAGTDALQNPEVQAQMLKVAQDKFPELASQAKDQISAWANDPAVQAQAQHYAGVALSQVKGAPMALLNVVEQGPDGVRLLAFGAGVASLVMSALTIINPLNALAIIMYTLAAYQVIFAISTMLFEMNPEWMNAEKPFKEAPFARIPGIEGYQKMLMEYCSFLTLNGGRGMFYIFQGSLWLLFADSLEEIPQICVGAFQVFIGALHVGMHFGIMPQHVALKMKHHAEKVSGMDLDGDGHVGRQSQGGVPVQGRTSGA